MVGLGVGGLWPERCLNVGEGGGWCGLRALFLGLTPTCHVTCLRERLLLRHRDHCPPPLMGSGFQPLLIPFLGSPQQDGGKKVPGGSGVLRETHQADTLQATQPFALGSSSEWAKYPDILLAGKGGPVRLHSVLALHKRVADCQVLHGLFFPEDPLALPLEHGEVPSLVDGAPGRGEQWIWNPLGCSASMMQGACGRRTRGGPWGLKVGVGSVRSTPLLCWLICRTKLLMAFAVSCFPVLSKSSPIFLGESKTAP